MRSRPFHLLALPLLATLACTSTLGGAIPGAAQAHGPLVTANPFATATGTPFPPLAPTATPLPSATATATPLATATAVDPWGYYPAPIERSAIDVPRQAPVIPFPDGVVNIVILGSDARPFTGGHRTDTIMVASLDPTKGTVTLLSFPRDLYVFVPGWRVDRINIADGRGGPDLVEQTILYNFGIPIDFWVRIEFSGFRSLIDSLGGVDVTIGKYYADECGGLWRTFNPGVRHMDGYTALCYARMRKAASDYDRLRRQQELVLAIFDRGVSLDALSRVPELYQQFISLVETNAGLSDVLPLVPLGAQVAGDASRIRRFAVDTTMATGWRVPSSGASVQLPNYEAIQTMLATAFPYP
ncbi:MAG TPA: LCP family protein [Anaerolineales bacterium]|nr:LCP family protein [Anaerolineales bacterium]